MRVAIVNLEITQIGYSRWLVLPIDMSRSKILYKNNFQGARNITVFTNNYSAVKKILL